MVDTTHTNFALCIAAMKYKLSHYENRARHKSCHSPLSESNLGT